MIGEELKRNEVIYCNFGNNQKTSVQSGYRYAIVVSNNKGNRFSTVVTVIPFTTKLKKNLPTHLNIEGFGTLLAEQIQTISKMQIVKRVKVITDEDIIKQINDKVKIALDIE